MRRLAAVLIALLPSGGTAQDFFTLKGHGGPIMDIAVSPSGQIATASFDNSVGIWAEGMPNWLEGHTAAVNEVIFLSHETLASAGDDFSIVLWHRRQGLMRQLTGHKGKIVGMAALPQRHVLASASWDGTIGLWQLRTSFDSKKAGTPDSSQGEFLKGHTQGVNDVVFADDAALYSASIDGTIRIWDIDQLQEKQVLVKHGFGINCLALNKIDGWLAYGSVDGVTRIIDPDTGAQIADFTLDRRPVLALALSPDGQHLAVGDGHGYIMVIDTRTWRITRDFRATLHGPVWALAFSADGQNIYAGGLDDAMYSWPIATLNEHPKMPTQQRSFLKDPSEMTNGERQFQRKCSICHSLSDGSARRAGPTLYQLFGRPAGVVPDYLYSETLNKSPIIWDEDSINALFDLGPDHYIPGSKMPMQRITNPDDRADLIAFLRQATTKEPAD